VKVLLDTNILIRHTASNDPRQPAVRAALAKLSSAGNELCVCAQSVVEYWTMSTRPLAANPPSE
jgi:predicted nucleic acid-binding protein